MNELGLKREWDQLYQLYADVFAQCITGLRQDGVMCVLVSDRKWSGTVVAKHSEVRRIVESLGLSLFAHKIVMKHDHIDLYHMGYSHLLCFRNKKSKTGKLHQELKPDVIKPFPQFRGAVSFRHALGFTPQLMHMLIESFSQKGDVVTDPFCGIGTLVRVALGTGRHTVGYDTDVKLKDYWTSRLFVR